MNNATFMQKYFKTLSFKTIIDSQIIGKLKYFLYINTANNDVYVSTFEKLRNCVKKEKSN